MKTKFILTISLMLCVLTVFAQKVENVHARLTTGESVIITYDLLYSDLTKEFTVELFVTTNNGQSYTPVTKNIEGETGENIKPGKNKTVTWYPFKNNPGYNVRNAQFKVTSSLAPKGMVFVKGGTFQMGNNNGLKDEKPMHRVTVGDFYIGRYEVTQKQWKDIMGTNPSGLKGDNLPVGQVSWNDIQEFLEKLNQKTGKNYRLPTEAEWEYAARGGNKSKGYRYSGSFDIGSVAWYKKNSNRKIYPVGQKQSNELGIYDMSGNVAEWCSDWYDSNYYSSSPENNPKGPEDGKYRICRGGASDGIKDGNCRISSRSRMSPDYRWYNKGFRIVCSL